MLNFRCKTSNQQLSGFTTTSLDSRGFTIIELLLVFSLIAVISVVSFASLSSYNSSQKLTNGAQDLKSMLEYAKSQTLSQVNTCSTGQQFVGYKVLTCCQGGSCPVCLSSNNYEVDEVCSGGSSLASSKNLPQGVTIDTASSTSFSFLFTALSGSVTGAGTVTLKQGSTAKNIVVSSTGVIQ